MSLVFSMCRPDTLATMRNRRFQLSNTLVTNGRSNLDHSSFMSFHSPFSVVSRCRRSLCLRQPNPKKSSGLASGDFTGIWSFLNKFFRYFYQRQDTTAANGADYHKLLQKVDLVDEPVFRHPLPPFHVANLPFSVGVVQSEHGLIKGHYKFRLVSR